MNYMTPINRDESKNQTAKGKKKSRYLHYEQNLYEL